MSETRKILGGTGYIERGRGDALVLIHGVGLNAEAWGPQTEAFSMTHRVIALDMLGHGASMSAAPGATLNDYVQQVLRLLDGLNVASASVAGHSMGGLVAIGLAIAAPQRVKRLCVLSSVYERSAAARSAVEARAAEMLRAAPNHETALARWFDGKPSAIRDRVEAWLKTVDPQGYATAYHVFAKSDRLFSGKLHRITCPSLFATGEFDLNSTPDMAEAMAAATPRGRSAVLPGARHLMNLTAPAETNSLLMALLSEAS